MVALTTKELPPIILMGGSHHNGLGLVRSFGIHGVRPYGIIVCSADKPKESFIAHSRYWKKTFLVTSNEEALYVLQREFGSVAEQMGQKAVVITWSDSTEMTVDQHLESLKGKFALPSAGGVQGRIVSLMDKEKQVEFCKEQGLRMAQSLVVNLEEENLPEDIAYPVMFKPVTSAEGEKLDIRKCASRDEALCYMKVLRQKGYRRFLVQEYIDFDRELEFVGSTGKEDAYLISENLREWPVIGGTNSFFGVVKEKYVKDGCKEILAAMKAVGYSGCFDVEFFDVKGEIYVNEFNWRNTGNSFFQLGTGVPYALIWYLSQCGQDTSKLRHTTDDTNQYAMNEATDLRHVVYGSLSLWEWLRDCHRTQSFALWFIRDPIPTIRQYAYLFREMLHRLK